MAKIVIIGANGYTGLELLRLLATHKEAEVVSVSSRQFEGDGVTDVFPSLAGIYDGLNFDSIENSMKLKADVFFLALPHGASMDTVKELSKTDALIIDLSADFRLSDKDVYFDWYGEHTCPELLDKAVYGLPELFRKEIKGKKLIANPGCYPTGAALALAPILKDIDTASIIIDSKSGTSGAGRSAAIETSFVEVTEGFHPYKIASHRHTPEIEQTLSVMGNAEIKVSFTPHLLPVSRGILTTAYANLKEGRSTEDLIALYMDFYLTEEFVRVKYTAPDIKDVRGSNYCDINVTVDSRTGRVIIVSAIDNLVKGASGQAIQNMNICLGFDESEGLLSAPLSI
ncbi:MAG: N-acetyl-gamma-glutamyl-phosphate reductase [Deltaproteobacteria bacterium]|nr:N-acetyl-gamma-glutamyl-phosphate reductase [Deltaproteobacteria bacterium]